MRAGMVNWLLVCGLALQRFVSLHCSSERVKVAEVMQTIAAGLAITRLQLALSYCIPFHLSLTMMKHRVQAMHEQCSDCEWRQEWQEKAPFFH
jgi:hypothetical protein